VLFRSISLALVVAMCSALASTTPLTAKDISLMLRSGYSSETILKDLSVRRFADRFDLEVEKQLVRAGAGQALIETLRSGVYQLSPAEIAAIKQRPSQPSTTSEQVANSPVNSVRSTPPPEVQMGGTMYDHLKGDLVYWHNGNLVPFDDEALERKRFYLLFFSASWSKEGRQLTTRLSDYYNQVLPQHPELEVVFFSVDRSAFAMENYISQSNMPWPAVAYDKRGGKAGAIQQSLANHVPRLILADANGKVLSDSGENQPDFNKVLADLDRILVGK
jgi:hypothetical protein